MFSEAMAHISHFGCCCSLRFLFEYAQTVRGQNERKHAAKHKLNQFKRLAIFEVIKERKNERERGFITSSIINHFFFAEKKNEKL